MPSLTGGNEETLTLQIIVEGLEEANRKLDDMDKKIGDSAQKWGGIGDMIKTSVAVAVGTILVDALKKAWEWAKMLYGALEDIVSDAIDFESMMVRVQIAAGQLEDGGAIGTKTFEDMSEAALQLGKDVDIVGVDATQAAAGLEILYLAGFNNLEIFGKDGLQGTVEGTSEAYGIFKVAADLAAISQLDLNGATELSTAILNTFGGTLEETGDPIVDAQNKIDFLNESINTIVVVSDSSVANIEDFQGALKNVGPTAAGLGYDLEEVAIAIGVMSDRGISAQEAGTALRRMLANVNRDTKKVNDTLDDLGVSLFDEEGNLRDLGLVFSDFSNALSMEHQPTLVSVTKATGEQTQLYNEAIKVYDSMTEKISLHDAGLKILSDSTLEKYQSQLASANQVMDDYAAIGTEQIEIDKALTEEQRARIIQTVAGVYGQNAFNALLSEGGNAMGNLREETKNATTFQERFDAILETSAAKIEKVTSFWETLKLEIGTGFLKAIGDVLGELTEWLDTTDALDEASAAIVSTIEWLTGVIAGKLVDVIKNLPGYIQSAKEGWDKLQEGFQQGSGWIEENVVPVLNQLKEWFDIISPVIKDMVQTYIYGYLIPAYEQIWKVIQEKIMPWVERLVDLFKRYVPVALKYLADLWNNTLKPAFEVFSKFMVEFVIPAIGEIADIILSVVVPVLETWIEIIINDIIPALSEMWTWIGENIIPVLSDMVDWLIENALPALSELSVYITEEVVPAISEFWAWIAEQLIPVIEEFIPNVVAAYESFIEWKDKIVEFIDEALAKMHAWFQDNIIPIIEKLVEIYNESLVPAFQAVSSFITETLIPALSDMWTFIQENVVPVLEAFWEVVEEVLGFLGDLATLIAEFIEVALTSMYNYFVENILPIWTEFVELIRDTVQPIIEDIQAFIEDEVIPTLVDWYDKLVEVKDTVVSLVQDALQALWDILTEKVLPVFKEIYDFIKEFFQVILKNVADNEVQNLTDKVNILKDALGFLKDVFNNVRDAIAGFRDKLGEVEVPDPLKYESPPPLVQALMDTRSVMDALTTKSIPAMANAFDSLNNPMMAGVSTVANSTVNNIRNTEYNLETHSILGPGELGLEFREMELASR